MITKKTLQTLEFDKILGLLTEFAVSQTGKRAILDMVPTDSIKAAQQLLDTTEEMYLVYNKYNLAPVVPFDEITEPVKKAGMGATLLPSELLRIARMVRSARIAKKELNAAGSEILHLKEAVSMLLITSELEKAINESIAGEQEIKDGASDTLRALRRKISAADARLKEKLASYTRASNLSKYLQDSIVTIRNGRFVLPVKSECRNEIPGLIHDQSASGATVFIEPLPIVEMNNELKSLQLEEAREIERILKALSDMTAAHAQNLENCQKVCTMLDITYAKIQFSCSFRGTKPLLNENGRVILNNARHPLIDKDTVVPVGLSFGTDYKLLLITGPNTGGKTVCLKTAGLFCIMACCGLFLPCDDSSEVSVFDGIYCDIGDDQSILNSLSTFSSHIVNIADITRRVTARSLVLLDELGGGTDPAEGSALALGIIRYLEKSGACGIITTHYGALKQYAMLSKSITNGCMQFDERTLKPAYKLLIGIPGASHALKISESLGLNAEILQTARQEMNGQAARLEEALAEVEKTKAETAREYEQAKRARESAEESFAALERERAELNEKIEKLNVNARQEVKRVVGNTLDKANELIDEIAALVQAADERALLEAKRLRTQMEQLQYPDPADAQTRQMRPVDPDKIKIGMPVHASGFDTELSVVSLPNKRGELTVSAGNKRFLIHVSKLSEPVEKPTRAKVKRHAKPAQVPQTDMQFAPSVVEIKLLGMTVSEAVEALEPYILSRQNQSVTLKIVHGKGTGALGKGIQSYLASLKTQVKSVRYGTYGEGERGVTFAELF